MGPAEVEALWRIESARIVAALTRFTGDFGLAEDAAQEAVAEALVSWPRAAPANPRAGSAPPGPRGESTGWQLTNISARTSSVGGLASEQIARALLVPVPTVQARITRAKKTIAAVGVPFELPPAGERRGRLGGVLSVLYVIFTEGSTATSGDRVLRPRSRTRRSG
jgi:predicted RNA polymerase sigma factor